MTDIVLSTITGIEDLIMFKGVYNKGGDNKLNISKISRELKSDRKTVRKYLKGEIPKKTRNRKKYLDDFYNIIKELLNDSNRSFDYIDHLYRYMVREYKINCSRSTFNRYVQLDEVLRKSFKTQKSRVFTERFETEPGQQAQFDLKERVKVIFKNGESIVTHVATLTLGFSRYNVRRIVLDKSYETISAFLAEAFEEIGGVPNELVIDNIKCLVDKPRTDKDEAILNVKFIEFLKDYNIECIPCMPYRPQTKGKTETQNKVPAQLRNYNGTYTDVLDVHDILEIINKEDNESISQATHLPRTFLLEKEKDEFSPLPPRRIREKYHLSLYEVNVSRESLISYKSKKYSVPKKFIGFKVNLVVRNNNLHIHYNNKIIAVHRISKKIMNIKDEHKLTYKEYDSNESLILQEMRNINYDNNE